MALLVSIVVFVLAAAVHAVGQKEGFLSIDCGLENSSGYQDNNNIEYVPDGPYVDGGTSYSVAESKDNNPSPLNTLRSFPSGERNCYSLPTRSGGKYLVRLGFYYGNYDGKNRASPAELQFDVHLGLDFWNSVYSPGVTLEAIFVAWASWVPVCLVKTGPGTPFVNLVELRPLADTMYPAVMANQSMNMYKRINMGASSFLRYPNDTYDRYWWGMDDIYVNPTWTNDNTSSTITEDSMFGVPSAVLQTAVTTTSGNNTVLPVITWQATRITKYTVFLHFADFQRDKGRKFDAYINNPDWVSIAKEFFPLYLSSRSVYFDRLSDADGQYNITLVATNDSALPPIINAFEIYSMIVRNTTTTFSEDFDAIMAIKFEYEVKKNWMGDPCFPINLSWDGVKCNTTGDITRIISLDLSNSNLRGEISNNFTLLTALENLNLSGNQLNGSIPNSLCKNNGGQFVFSYGSDENICNKTIGPPRQRKTVVIVISVVVPVLVAAVLVAYLIWRMKRKPNKPVSAYDPLSVPDPKNSTGNRTNQLDHLQKTENRRFTYEELKKFTDNFQQFIGQGGFGKVYFGCLENSSEVAVKMLSELSSQGLDEFLAEVQSLTKVHHKNLVSLVGYCWEKNHLALVYEYMSRGSLYNHLRGKIDVGDTFNWAIRVRVVLEAAQGLDYLHKGCNLPIIHGDVKTNNVLLGHNLKAKLADFGLSKTYNSETQTHISTPAAAGTMGYIDPEYYLTGMLTESSDVYSFGIVLLEVATGEPPILPGHGHIIQRVKQNITSGNTDARLKGSYDVNSMWKVVDTAMMCTADVAAQRPTMSNVVVQLKESLALEEAREDIGFTVSSVSDAISEASTFGPSAR